MIVECQQQDTFKIRDKIPGHGPQKVCRRSLGVGSERVLLECGCSLPLTWLTGAEREGVLREIPKPIQRWRWGSGMTKAECHAFMLSLGMVLFHTCSSGARHYRPKREV